VNPDARPLVLHVIHQLAMGGLENGLVNLINGLPESSLRHAIACVEDASDFRRRLRRSDVEVFALHRSQVGVWRARRELYRLCRRLKPSIVHTRNLSGLDALLPARLAGVGRCVHGEHGWDVDNLRGERWRPLLLRWLHSPLVDRYIVVSRDLERYLVQRVGVNPSRIVHICNGVDVERFAPARGRRPDVLPPELRGDAPLVIGTVGRTQPVKDQATLLRAFAGLVRADPALRERLRLVIVGDGPLRGELRALAASLGVADLAWLPGALANVPDVLRAMDIFVLPSLAEGISNTILEAMASGLPILATAVGGNVEIVEADKWGRFFAPGDVAALTRLLGEYVQDRAQREAHGATARRAAVERFSLSTMVEGYHATYAALLSGDCAVRA
jgi:sugar transferase (PEP-CTERM/EpsH1 system associated)